jgi:ABC-type transport system substrate-binding protein
VGGPLQPASTSLRVLAQYSLPFVADSKGRLLAEMATDIPTVQNGGIRDDGKTYVIHLKHGMRWSNGTEITSADVVFGWKVSYDPDARYCGSWCVVTAIDAPDRYTAVYHLSQIDHAFLLRDIPEILPTRWPGYWDGDPHAAVLKGSQKTFNWLGPQYPSDGPYQVTRAAGNRMELRPMKYYDVMSCGAYIKHITYYGYTTPAREVAALEAGKLDIAVVGGTAASSLGLQRLHSPYRVHVDPTGAFEHVEFNVDPTYRGQPNPLHDTRVRQALALAVDKRALVANVLGLTARQVSNVVQWSFCVNSPKYRSSCADPSITGQWDPIARRYDPNPGRGTALLDAKKLLNQTPWRRGFTLDFAERPGLVFRVTEREALAADWARVGVKVRVSIHPSGIFFAPYDQGGVLARGQFQAAIVQVIPSQYGLDAFAAQWLTTPFVGRRPNKDSQILSQDQDNYSGISDPVIDEAISSANGTVDEQARARDFGMAQEETAKQAYWDVLYASTFTWVEDQRVANLTDSVDNLYDTSLFWDEWAWKVRK